MGDSHYKSNIIGKLGTEKISNFHTASVDVCKCATLEGTTSVTSPKVICTNYVTLGTNQYIYFGTEDNKASVLAAATALTGTPLIGSLYLSTSGNVYRFPANDVATPLPVA